MTEGAKCGWFKHSWGPWHRLYGDIIFRTCTVCHRSQNKRG